MSFLQITSALIVLAGAFGAINYHLLRLPASIGIMAVALAASLALMLFDALFPASGIADAARAVVKDIDFSEALL